jgi:uncharacterized protein HemY
MENFSLQPFARLLIFMGVVFLVIGIILMIAPKIPYLGRLPGDILIRRKNFTFYFPITTLIILNLVLFLISYLLRK